MSQSILLIRVRKRFQHVFSCQTRLASSVQSSASPMANHGIVKTITSVSQWLVMTSFEFVRVVKLVKDKLFFWFKRQKNNLKSETMDLIL